MRTHFLLKHIPDKGKILDIGNLADDGMIHKELMEKLPDAELYGLDIDDQRQSGLSFPRQVVGRAEAMPYDDNFFDAIYMGEVFEHTWEPLTLLKECNRVLKQGGVLILDTPNVYSMARMLRYFVTGKDVILGNPDHKIFYSRAMMENALEKTGYSAIETTTDRKFSIKGRHMILPPIGPFHYFGEHLQAVARKAGP